MQKYLRTPSALAKTQKNERSLWMGMSFDFSDREHFLYKNAHLSQYMHVHHLVCFFCLVILKQNYYPVT